MEEGERAAWETGGRRSDRYSRICAVEVQGFRRGLARAGFLNRRANVLNRRANVLNRRANRGGEGCVRDGRAQV